MSADPPPAVSADTVRSWGGVPTLPQTPHRPAWRDDAQQQLTDLAARHGNTLPFGNGRSYGDSCLAASDQVIQTRLLDRLIRADWSRGLVVAEAGMTLAELHAISIPLGWFAPVTPGTQFVTLGGAVANDVHGKNHHVRGTFGCHVQAFSLVRSDSQVLDCSPTERPDLFCATIGGLGLTGLITTVTLQLMRIGSAQLLQSMRPFRNVQEFFALSDELDPKHEYTVSWFDCMAQGESRGRGVHFAADHIETGTRKVARPRLINVPITPPFNPMNRLALRVFNTVYHAAHQSARQAPVHYDPFFYPLDRIGHWNRLYGTPGFQQFQCVIPQDAALAGISRLLDAVADSGSGSFLAVLKRCGTVTSPGWLSFPMPGTSLALDFPQTPALQTVLFPRLDAIVRDHGGRLYPAKDAHMSGEDFRRAYPRWTEVEALRDPGLLSRFWKRVTA